jgi:hypothetical protein
MSSISAVVKHKINAITLPVNSQMPLLVEGIKIDRFKKNEEKSLKMSF